jgi:glucans biosynthesis protein
VKFLNHHGPVIFLFLLLTWGQTAGANDIFGLNNVAALAQKLAAEPFAPPQPVPEFLKQLTYDQYREIRFDPAQSLWKDGGRFQVRYLHPGLFYGHSVAINIRDSEGIKKAAFSPKLFDYGRNKIADKIPADLGFAGFQIAYELYRQGTYNNVLVFVGASYFRAVAKDNVFGLSARGLAIDTALPSGEEFPFFREFWLERPSKSARELKIFALLDSRSVTGAYEFVLRPGARTIVDVQARLFVRKQVKELGVAPLTSMFFYGEEKPRPAGEWRPEVHDSDGLLMHSSTGEWVWRPLGNPEKLRISYFELENPKGFGLLQRDRNFYNYEDLETRHELRPNAWIAPVGNWGKGHVKLVEIPTQKETNDNIVAYWIPARPLGAGQSSDLAYRIYFHSDDPVGASLGRTTAMRIGRGDKEEWRTIVVDFEGSNIKSLPPGAPLRPFISVGQNGQLVQDSLLKNPVTGGWRLSFQVKPTRGKPLELRASLRNEGETLTEVWSYQLEP